ncbi:hypothetical protein BJ912DRAFT_1002989 [Pholiota molesta]|nr:hypothetical protein BJ912DRAFT_1002989 [Pholiota molesta]
MSVAATGISDMPIKLLQKILDLLHDDPAALYAASLVCRDWVSAPRHHMFRRMVIKEVWIPMRRAVLVHENVESFLALTQSRYCTILRAVRCAILCIPTTVWLVEVVKVLRRADALSQVVFFQDRSSDPPSWMAGMLPDVHDFTFNTWSILDKECWDSVITLPHTISGSTFSNIRNMQLRLVESEELFGWMNSFDGSPVSRVETLDLVLFRSSHKGLGATGALNSFLRRNSKTVMHLIIAISYEPAFVRQDKSDEDLDLSPLSNLRSLVLEMHDMDAVCNAIASLTSHYVESLTVRTAFWSDDGHNFDHGVECHCEFYNLFTKLSKIMEVKQFISQTRTLHLRIPKQPRFNWNSWYTGDVFVGWTPMGDLTFGSDDIRSENIYNQRNTYATLRHLLLWEHPLHRSALPGFLR